MSERELTGLRGRNRGQTTQDFAVGISVFLLTVTFTFAFVPSSVTPFGSPVTDAIPEKSDRVAATIVNDYGGEDRTRSLSFTELDADIFGSDGDALRSAFGLRSTAQVNVTIQNDDGDILDHPSTGDKLVAGDAYNENQAAASTTRVVRIEGVDGCNTGCVLVVRVW